MSMVAPVRIMAGLNLDLVKKSEVPLRNINKAAETTIAAAEAAKAAAEAAEAAKAAEAAADQAARAAADAYAQLSPGVARAQPAVQQSPQAASCEHIATNLAAAYTDPMLGKALAVDVVASTNTAAGNAERLGSHVLNRRFVKALGEADAYALLHERHAQSLLNELTVLREADLGSAFKETTDLPALCAQLEGVATRGAAVRERLAAFHRSAPGATIATTFPDHPDLKDWPKEMSNKTLLQFLELGAEKGDTRYFGDSLSTREDIADLAQEIQSGSDSRDVLTRVSPSDCEGPGHLQQLLRLIRDSDSARRQAEGAPWPRHY
jgi:hypothetical protein